MKRKQGFEKTKRSSMSGLGIGALLAILLSILLSGCAALLVVEGHVQVEKMHYFTLCIQYLAVLLGALTAAKLTGKAPALMCGIIAMVYIFLLLAVNILFLEGGISSIWGPLLVIGLGWASACAICISKARKVNYRKAHNR